MAHNMMHQLVRHQVLLLETCDLFLPKIMTRNIFNKTLLVQLKAKVFKILENVFSRYTFHTVRSTLDLGIFLNP